MARQPRLSVVQGIVMRYIMVDVEADGPIPGDYSMIALGAILVDDDLDKTFYGCLKPMTERWQAESLAVAGFSREETLTFDEPGAVMAQFATWLAGQNGAPLHFVSDNTGFDWQFVNFYFHHFLGHNPFGHCSLHLGSLYKGVARSMFGSFKHLRRTVHSHHALDDARGNAEAFLTMCKTYEIKY